MAERARNAKPIPAALIPFLDALAAMLVDQVLAERPADEAPVRAGR
jgi:hypothetical protein